MTYVIAEPCIDVKDRACVDECPVDCIYEGPRMLYIHPDECVDCGACEPVCPVTAIFYEDDVPADRVSVCVQCKGRSGRRIVRVDTDRGEVPLEAALPETSR